MPGELGFPGELETLGLFHCLGKEPGALDQTSLASPIS